MIFHIIIFTFVVSVRCDYWLQILHTNDIHARFDEIDVYCGSCTRELSKNKKCFGGLARMKKAIDIAKREAADKGIPTINLNAGDTFDGTPSYTTYKWKIVAEFIDRMEFDAMSLGNHEFVDGIDNLVSFLNNIKTPVVCANLNSTVDRRLHLPILTPSRVLTVRNKKIGIVGYLTPHTVDLTRNEDLISLEIPRIRAEARRLKSEGVDIIIALGHSGFPRDKQIAFDVEEVSLVIGAHSHTFMYNPPTQAPSVETPETTYPRMTAGKPVVQAYAYSKYLGKLLVRFDDHGKVVTASGNPQLLDGSVEKDSQLDKDISRWLESVDQRYNFIQGYTLVPLLRPNFMARRFESTFGNLITDAILDYAVTEAKRKSSSSWAKSTIVLQSNSGIRISIDNAKNQGGITMKDLMIALPFNEPLVELAVYGTTIKKLLEFSVQRYDRTLRVYDLSNYLLFSGIKVEYDLSRSRGYRVVSVHVLCANCRVPEYLPLIDHHVYHLITTTYLTFERSSYITRDEHINKTLLGITNFEAVIRYLKKHQIVYPINDGRISVTGYEKPQVSDDESSTSRATASVFISILTPSIIFSINLAFENSIIRTIY